MEYSTREVAESRTLRPDDVVLNSEMTKILIRLIEAGCTEIIMRTL